MDGEGAKPERDVPGLELLR